MKKLIAILSTVSALGFAVALANVNTSGNPSGSSDMSNSGSMSGDTSGGMSGTAPADPSSSDMSKDSSKDMSSDKTTAKKHEKWSSAKSCTDENGVTFYKGKSGFQACVDKMKKHDQMGGTSPSDSSGSIMDKSDHSDSTTVSPPDSTSPPNS